MVNPVRTRWWAGRGKEGTESAGGRPQAPVPAAASHLSPSWRLRPSPGFGGNLSSTGVGGRSGGGHRARFLRCQTYRRASSSVAIDSGVALACPGEGPDSPLNLAPACGLVPHPML